ncbi:MAG: NUDIX hydrolase [Ectothiorhodospiraceae bacterium]|nr:NUDIX hydrolase [Ectothiorhodospiraceae bacterium]
MVWKPHVTVASVIELDGRFLMVEERSGGQLVLNQPAGHLEPGESLVDAAVRETREETAWTFRPEFVVGVYRWYHAAKRSTFLRVCFAGTALSHDPIQALDEGIVRALWLSLDEIRDATQRLRSPMVLRNIEDYLAGHRYPVDLVQDISDGPA